MVRISCELIEHHTLRPIPGVRLILLAVSNPSLVCEARTDVNGFIGHWPGLEDGHGKMDEGLQPRVWRMFIQNGMPFVWSTLFATEATLGSHIICTVGIACQVRWQIRGFGGVAIAHDQITMAEQTDQLQLQRSLAWAYELQSYPPIQVLEPFQHIDVQSPTRRSVAALQAKLSEVHTQIAAILRGMQQAQLQGTVPTPGSLQQQDQPQAQIQDSQEKGQPQAQLQVNPQMQEQSQMLGDPEQSEQPQVQDKPQMQASLEQQGQSQQQPSRVEMFEKVQRMLQEAQRHAASQKSQNQSHQDDGHQDEGHQDPRREDWVEAIARAEPLSRPRGHVHYLPEEAGSSKKRRKENEFYARE
ncbi:hypothetical protein BKA61DRAFT_55366 [Leptodontidium sp. MPI-SDFR-AT-0119]|nr:hypothetical protein BKA61DRAFT_55366 [Leptodontidium sp. MPI-SDFR-AT-0119]